MNGFETTRRGFLGLLAGLAGSQLLPDLSLLDPTPEAVADAKAANKPISGDMWISDGAGGWERLGQVEEMHQVFHADTIEVGAEGDWQELARLNAYTELNVEFEFNGNVEKYFAEPEPRDIRIYLGDCFYDLPDRTLTQYTTQSYGRDRLTSQIRAVGGPIKLREREDLS